MQFLTPPPCTQYEIAKNVFDREADFDADYDSLVRVQVSRLRTMLDKYYENEGATDPIIITIPKGTYDISFAARCNQQNVHQSQQLEEAQSQPNSDNRNLFADGHALLRDHWPSLLFASSVLIAIALIAPDIVARLTPLSSQKKTTTQQTSSEQKIIVKTKCSSEGVQSETTHGSYSDVISNGLIERLSRSKRIEIYLDNGKRLVPAQSLSKFCLKYQSKKINGETLLSFKLIESTTKRLVWARSYWTTDQKISSEAESLIDEIASNLQGKLYELSATSTSKNSETKTPEELFLMSTWVPGHTGTSLEWHMERIALARQALEIDPDFGPAHSVLADKIAFITSFYNYRDTPLRKQQATEHAFRALELSPGDPDVLFNVGLYHFHAGDDGQAAQYFRRVLEIVPHHPVARIIHNVQACQTPSRQEFSELMSLDKQLDPGDHLRWLTQEKLCEFHLSLGDLENSAIACAKSYAIFNSPTSSSLYAAVLAARGKDDSARKIMERVETNWPKFNLKKLIGSTLAARCSDGDSEAIANHFNAYSKLLQLHSAKPNSYPGADFSDPNPQN